MDPDESTKQLREFRATQARSVWRKKVEEILLVYGFAAKQDERPKEEQRQLELSFSSLLVDVLHLAHGRGVDLAGKILELSLLAVREWQAEADTNSGTAPEQS